MKVSNVHYLIRFVKCEVKKFIFSIREMRMLFFTTVVSVKEKLALVFICPLIPRQLSFTLRGTWLS